ncbi:MAG: hypothetical protein WDN06_14330 [Asticcacaulis sp.]
MTEDAVFETVLPDPKKAGITHPATVRIVHEPDSKPEAPRYKATIETSEVGAYYGVYNRPGTKPFIAPRGQVISYRKAEKAFRLAEREFMALPETKVRMESLISEIDKKTPTLRYKFVSGLGLTSATLEDFKKSSPKGGKLLENVKGRKLAGLFTSPQPQGGRSGAERPGRGRPAALSRLPQDQDQDQKSPDRLTLARGVTDGGCGDLRPVTSMAVFRENTGLNQDVACMRRTRACRVRKP